MHTLYIGVVQDTDDCHQEAEEKWLSSAQKMFVAKLKRLKYQESFY